MLATHLTLNEILLILFDTFVFLSDLHQELVQGPHPREDTDVSPACPELTGSDEVVQEVWGFQIAWCITVVSSLLLVFGCLLFSFRDHGSCKILSLLVDGVVFNTMFDFASLRQL